MPIVVGRLLLGLAVLGAIILIGKFADPEDLRSAEAERKRARKDSDN